MVVSFEVKHIFKYPLDLVAYTHLTKYPTDKETDVVSVKTVKQIVDEDGVEYWHRVACCQNVLPSVLRKLRDLDQKYIYIEEECWLDHPAQQMNIRSRNLTWRKYVKLKEESLFQQLPENPNWTHLYQQGTVDVHGIKHIGWLIERFAEKFLQVNIKKSLKVMEELLQERMNALQTSQHIGG